MLNQFGASIFPATAGTDLLTTVTTTVADNITIVLVVVGGIFGINFARRMLNRGLKGKV